MAYSNLKKLSNEKRMTATFSCSQCQRLCTRSELAQMEDCDHALCSNCVKEAANWTEVGQVTCQVCLNKTGIGIEDFLGRDFAASESSEGDNSLSPPPPPPPPHGQNALRANSQSVSNMRSQPGYTVMQQIIPDQYLRAPTLRYQNSHGLSSQQNPNIHQTNQNFITLQKSGAPVQHQPNPSYVAVQNGAGGAPRQHRASPTIQTSLPFGSSHYVGQPIHLPGQHVFVPILDFVNTNQHRDAKVDKKKTIAEDEDHGDKVKMPETTQKLKVRGNIEVSPWNDEDDEHKLTENEENRSGTNQTETDTEDTASDLKDYKGKSCTENGNGFKWQTGIVEAEEDNLDEIENHNEVIKDSHVSTFKTQYKEEKLMTDHKNGVENEDINSNFQDATPKPSGAIPQFKDATRSAEDTNAVVEECNRYLSGISSNLSSQAQFIDNQQTILDAQINNYLRGYITSLQSWSAAMKMEVQNIYNPSLTAIQFNQAVVNHMRDEVKASKDNYETLTQKLEACRAIHKVETEIGRYLPVYEVVAQPIQNQYGSLSHRKSIMSSALPAHTEVPSTHPAHNGSISSSVRTKVPPGFVPLDKPSVTLPRAAPVPTPPGSFAPTQAPVPGKPYVPAPPLVLGSGMRAVNPSIAPEHAPTFVHSVAPSSKQTHASVPVQPHEPNHVPGSAPVQAPRSGLTPVMHALIPSLAPAFAPMFAPALPAQGQALYQAASIGEANKNRVKVTDKYGNWYWRTESEIEKHKKDGNACEQLEHKDAHNKNADDGDDVYSSGDDNDDDISDIDDVCTFGDSQDSL